ncbi:41946_t:CDS:2 [Gigaspora margarita]|uniref:41946_t:CDS:1 n=1 Tax=Gigaspora margarita TaxID=4874 RepID=A0ABN7UFD0_GIGMA|nr:41946_t:CDS:2 [Gigaspora margarita]
MIPKESPIKSSIRGYNLSNEIFFLDLASSFSTTSPLYVDLPEMSYGSEKGTAVFGGPTKNDVYLVGGVFQNLTLLNQIDHNVTITLNQTLMLNELLNTWNVTDKHIFIYRPTTKNWIIPDVQGEKPPIRRRSTSTVIDQNGKIYMFGGRAQIDTGSLTFICFNDLYTYDTSISKWNKINAEKAPLPQSHSTATLLPNGKILYIGGVYQNSPGEVALQIDMNNIATLSIPIQARVGHTATLTPDNNKIIIIGGTTSYVLGQTTAYPVFVSLDITTEPYTYSELNVSGVQPPPLAYHTVTPYQNYMIVAFGNYITYF